MSDQLLKLIASLGAEKRATLAELLRPAAEPIAVVGMACRFPKAPSAAALWRLLESGGDAITTVPPSRWDAPGYIERDPTLAPTGWGGFLDDVAGFEPGVFGISPREALHLDPQQRLVLEVTWEALEDAGLPFERLAGTNAGVFIGSCTSEYGQICARDPRALGPHTGPGICNNMLSGRVSYVFDLRGPSLVIDTACSSSLVAVHLACESLRRKESSLALAGGVNLVLTPEGMAIALSMQLLAPDGRCKVFDARADGIARGEGCGVVVLKRLGDALADGDRVHAIIRGSATNHDGRSNGLTAPNPTAQRDAITRALAEGGVSPASVSFVETHGTGTPLGDPIEVEALKEVLGRGRAADMPCLLGSAKANLGHTEGAAGIAGVIKTVLALSHRTIPAQINFRRLNPHIGLDGTPFAIPTQTTPWSAPAPKRRIAGVSAFGWSGTNAHAVLEEAPAAAGSNGKSHASPDDAAPIMLPLSAQSPAALRALCGQWSRFLLEEGRATSLLDLAYTASCRRSHHRIREVCVGATHEELAAALGELAIDDRPFAAEGTTRAADRVVFVFPGQGSQWRGMGRALVRYEAFKTALEACDRALRPFTKWSVLELLGIPDEREANEARWREVDVIQPLLFSIQVSLAALWASWGVEPDAVVGHSLGEIAAAHVAGVLSLEDAARVIALRSQLVRTTSGKGRMALAELSMAEAQELTVRFGKRLSVAATNGPRTVLLSGETSAVESALDQLKARDVFCRFVEVDYASHCEQMEPLAPELRARLAPIRPRAGGVPLYSTVTAKPIAGETLDAEYWVDNLRKPVLFHPAVERLVRDGRDVFLEVSAHPVLVPSIESTLANLGKSGTALASTRRDHDERRAMLTSLGALHAIGRPVDFARHFHAPGHVVALPSYAWQRDRYWPAARGRARSGLGMNLGLLADARIDLHTGGQLWPAELGLGDLPYLADHKVGGAVVFPGAGFVELALAASRDVHGPGARVVTDVHFEQMLEIPDDGSKNVQVLVLPAGGDDAVETFQIASESDNGWTIHARGRLRKPETAANARPRVAMGELRARCVDPLAAEDFYDGAGLAGVDFGPSFRRLDEIFLGKGEAIARVRVDEATGRTAAGCEVDPTLLDACFQVLGCAMSTTASGSFLPIGIAEVRLHGAPRGGLWAHARVVEGVGQPGPRGDLALVGEDGEIFLEVRGLDLQRVGSTKDSVDEWLFSVDWEAKPLLSAKTTTERSTWIILGDDVVNRALGTALEEGGHRSVVVPTGPADRREHDVTRIDLTDAEAVTRFVHEVVAAADPPCGGILLAPGTDTGADSRDAPSACVGAFALVTALVKEALPRPPRLWLVTRGAQPLDDRPANPTLAALWGIGRTIPQEHPELRCSCVDLGTEPAAGEVAALADEVRAELDENQIAIRANDRYVARLAHFVIEETGGQLGQDTAPARTAPLAVAPSREALLADKIRALAAELLALAPNTPLATTLANVATELAPANEVAEPTAAAANDSAPAIDPTTTYLVTGGLGGLGLVVAGWLVAHGARHLALVGRSAPSAEAKASIASLEAAGARVAVLSCDVADEAAVGELFTHLREALPPLRGVVHAAGVLDDGVIQSLDGARLAHVMRPKALGAWNLHEATRGHELDFFLLFSSVASVLGSAGQANYAAANAFVDALAHARRAEGLPATSINWGAWRSVGLAAAQENRGDRLARRGLLGLSPSEGTAALTRLLAIQPRPTQVSALRLRMRDLRNVPISAFPIFARLLVELGDQQAAAGKVRAELEALDPIERRYRLEAYVRKEIAQILRLSPAAIDVAAALSSLGFDSLMALEFRNRLDLGLALRLSATALWAHRSIEELVPYLAAQMKLPLDTTKATFSVTAGAAPEDGPAFATIADTLADDDVEAALQAQLDLLDDGDLDHV